MGINSPSKNEVSKYLALWDRNDEYVLGDEYLKKLFTETYPRNTDMEDVLIKVCSLNTIYSTRISSPCAVAKHIVDLAIDQRLENKDKELVNQIAKVKVNGQKTRNFYSFATKYCSHHFPNDYCMYDSYVEKILWHFNRDDKFYEFKKVELKVYPKYHTVLMEFREFYGLEGFTLKEIDIYLWQAGKKYFSKQN